MSLNSSHDLLGSLQTLVANDGVLLPGSDEYKKENGSYFSAFENELLPKLIVRPQTLDEVKGVLGVLHPYMLSKNCKVAIRGAGHTPFAGSANIDGGITIDMRRLLGINLNHDKSIVTISAGETWSNVYHELAKHGLTVAGARVDRIGVVGFVLGGGLSTFSTRNGFACDTVIEFEVLLASGEVTNARKDHNADLWLALRGGLNNFGIVTALKMRTFPDEKIWGGIKYYQPEAFATLARCLCSFVYEELDKDSHIMFSAGYGHGQQGLSCVMYQLKGKDDSPGLAPFVNAEPQMHQMSSMRLSKHLDFCQELSRFSSDGVRQFWASITIKPNLDLLQSFYAEWQESLGVVQNVDGLTFSFGFNPLTRSLLAASQEAGGNSMAINEADGPLLVVLINPSWKRKEDDQKILTAIETLVQNLQGLAEKRGLLHRYIFANYAHKTDHVLQGYGEASLRRLEAASKKYDPDGLFQQSVPGGFKLRNGAFASY